MHLKLPSPLLSKEEMLGYVAKSRLRLVDFEDFTKFIIPGYKIINRKCAEEDPEMKVFTYPIVGHAFMEGKLAYNIYYLALE